VSAGSNRLVAGSQPPLTYPPYKSGALRCPTRPLIRLTRDFSDFTAPVYGYHAIGDTDADLTRQHAGEPLGERIIVSGRVLDEDGRPVRNTLVELWQANAAGRYVHVVDNHPAPLDPNFTGAGRTTTDDEPMFQSVKDESARQRMVSRFDLTLTEPEWALGYRFDIVLRGQNSTPFEGRT
jgi:protocatechuate 3,4-dioxygenase beta subunit